MKTQNLTKVLKLSQQLRNNGYSKLADDLEYKFLILKQSEAKLYSTFKEVGEDLIGAAHPDGSHKLVDVEGDSVFETIVDQHKKIKEKVEKEPTGKLSAKTAALLIKKASLGSKVLSALFEALEKAFKTAIKGGGKQVAEKLEKAALQEAVEVGGEFELQEALRRMGKTVKDATKQELAAAENEVIKNSNVIARKATQEAVRNLGLDKALEDQILSGLNAALVTGGKTSGGLSAASSRLKWIGGIVTTALAGGEIKSVYDWYQTLHNYSFGTKGADQNEMEYIYSYAKDVMKYATQVGYDQKIMTSLQAVIDNMYTIKNQEQITSPQDLQKIKICVTNLKSIKEKLKNELTPSYFMQIISALVPRMNDQERAKLYDLLSDDSYHSFISCLDTFVEVWGAEASKPMPKPTGKKSTYEDFINAYNAAKPSAKDAYKAFKDKVDANHNLKTPEEYKDAIEQISHPSWK
jgi:hypothetical protein